MLFSFYNELLTHKYIYNINHDYVLCLKQCLTGELNQGQKIHCPCHPN
jgi:hypothetical protein